MDALQAAGSVIQGVQALIQGVQALIKAARDLQDAPKRVAHLEGVLVDLVCAHRSFKRNLSSKMHHPELELQLSSLESLIRDFEPQVQRAKKLSIKRKKGVKMYLNAIVGAVTGDELAELAQVMESQLLSWIKRHSLKSAIAKSFSNTAEELSTLLRVESDVSYRPLCKASKIRELLETSASKVVLIHGLSGMGKSCLARHVASNPPSRFLHGAVDLLLGQSCSRGATGNNRDEYQKRLAAKFCVILRALGRRKSELDGINLDDACQLMQESFRGKSILVLLDDVWEPDIIARFTRLYDNGCKYLATTRNQSVYETTEADVVEVGKEDVQDLSMTILMHHSQLAQDELPDVAVELIERCGHHPLTLAVVGKALRGETRAEQWEKAMDELRTYASQAPVPNHYMNEKEVETAATVFGSFDYSLNSMVPHAKELFTSLATLSWDSLVPEACLESMWTALGQQSTFRLVVSRLLDGSLLRKKHESFYSVHDMVALYLETKRDEGISLVLKHSKQQARASVLPWLCHFGNRVAQRAAEAALNEIFWSNNEELPAVVLWNIVDVLSASSTMRELEASSVKFSRLVGPEVARFFLLDSMDLVAAITRCIGSCFTAQDYESYAFGMVQGGAIKKLARLLREHRDALVQRDAAIVLAGLAGYLDEALVRDLPVKELVELLGSTNLEEEIHEALVGSLMRLAMVGEEAAVEEMFGAGIEKKLEDMLLGTSEASQQTAMVLLKTFHEAGGSRLVRGFLRRPGIVERMPWQARLNLERLASEVATSRNVVVRGSGGNVKKGFLLNQVRILEDPVDHETAKLAALEEVICVAEAVGDQQVMDLVLATGLVEAISRLLLQQRSSTRVRSEACLALARLLSPSGGPRLIKTMAKSKTLESLVTLVSTSREIQEIAYWSLHDILFAVGRPVAEHLLKASLVERLVLLLDGGTALGSVELGMQAVQDLVEVGGKDCIQRLLSLHIVERLAALEVRGKPEAVWEFARAVKRCGSLSGQEKRVLCQQVLRQARGALSKGSPQLDKLNKSASERGEGSGGSGSGSRRRSL